MVVQERAYRCSKFSCPGIRPYQAVVSYDWVSLEDLGSATAAPSHDRGAARPCFDEDIAERLAHRGYDQDLEDPDSFSGRYPAVYHETWVFRCRPDKVISKRTVPEHVDPSVKELG
jgi:hypothetical protein